MDIMNQYLTSSNALIGTGAAVSQCRTHYRTWNGFDVGRFRLDLLNSRLCTLTSELDDMSADCFQQMNDDTLPTLLDKHAPRHVVRRRHQPTTPWFDSRCENMVLFFCHAPRPERSSWEVDTVWATIVSRFMSRFWCSFHRFFSNFFLTFFKFRIGSPKMARNEQVCAHQNSYGK